MYNDGASYSWDTSAASLAWKGEGVTRHYHGGCKTPVGVRYRFPAPRGNNPWNGTHWVYDGRHKEAKPRIGVELHTHRCRKCPVCVAHARHDWMGRADQEFKAARFTLWGTLTVSDRWFHEQWRAFHEKRDRKREAMYRNGEVPSDADWFADESADRDFQERDRARELQFMGDELKRLMKRLRKHGLSLRYLATTEFGSEKGRPHFHYVMHISSAHKFAEVRKLLKQSWEHAPGCRCKRNSKGHFVQNCRVGWVDAKLCEDEEAAHYAAKYIGKREETAPGRGVDLSRYRVRASQGYGHLASEISNIEDVETWFPVDVPRQPPKKPDTPRQKCELAQRAHSASERSERASDQRAVSAANQGVDQGDSPSRSPGATSAGGRQAAERTGDPFPAGSVGPRTGDLPMGASYETVPTREGVGSSRSSPPGARWRNGDAKRLRAILRRPKGLRENAQCRRRAYDHGGRHPREKPQ